MPQRILKAVQIKYGGCPVGAKFNSYKHENSGICSSSRQFSELERQEKTQIF